MEVEARKPLRGIATGQVGYMQQKCETGVNGAFNAPLPVDGQWTQVDLEVTGVAKENSRQKEETRTSLRLLGVQT